MIMTQDQIVDQFYNTYNNDLYYIPATKATEADPNKPGKVIYEYNKKKIPINKSAFIEHLTTGSKVVTIGQLNKDNQCKWGVIDIDDYSPDFVSKVKDKIYSNKYPLNIVQSVSGGLHLYLYSQELISGALMRNALAYYLDQLGLKPDTEIFPKQTELTEDTPYGNMIKLPFASGIDSKEIQTHLKKAKESEQLVSFFESLPKITVDENNSYKKSTKARCTIKQIKQNIKNKVDHERGGTFDNWITDLTAKLIAGRKTDNQITAEIKQCWLYAEKDPVGKFQKQDQDTYIENKIRNFRNKSNLEDPEILREKFIKNIHFVRKGASYFNAEYNDVYSKEVIETEYAWIMEPKVSPTQFFKFHYGKKIVEDFMYRPGTYNPDEIIFKLDKKKYINSYKPNDLVPMEGDLTIFNDHMEYLFPKEIERTHILDFISYIVQNPGEKIRHALFIISECKQVGKGRLFALWKKILGTNNTSEIEINEALDKSKGYLDNQLVLIDELKSQDNFTENKKLVNFLKRIISEENHRSRQLYVDFKEKYSTANFILHSNELNALSLDSNDPRYFVANCDVERREEDYYERLNDFIEGAGAARVLHYLKHRKISVTFKPKGAPPQTEAKLNMASFNLHPFTQKVLEDYKTQEYPFDKDIIASGDVRTHYEKVERTKIFRLNDISNALTNIGGLKIGQSAYTQTESTTKVIYPTIWIIRNHEKYKGLSAKEIVDQNLYQHAYSEDVNGKYYKNLPTPF